MSLIYWTSTRTCPDKHVLIDCPRFRQVRRFSLKKKPVLLLGVLLLLAWGTPSCGSGGQGGIGIQTGKIGPLEIATGDLPQGTVGQPYRAPLTASGGIPPYTWSIPFGQLPPGLSLNADSGAITGTPTQPGKCTFTARVVDSTLVQQQTAMAIVSASIEQPVVTITTTSLPEGRIGQPYSLRLEASGGTPPYTWSLLEGSLPPDLGLDASTGLIAGIPTQEGAFSFTIQVTDSSSPPTSASVRISTSPIKFGG